MSSTHTAENSLRTTGNKCLAVLDRVDLTRGHDPLCFGPADTRFALIAQAPSASPFHLRLIRVSA